MTAQFPPVEPGLPRFVVAAALCTVLAAVWAMGGRSENARPSAGTAQPAAANRESPLSGAELYISAGCAECHPTVGPSTALGPSLAGAEESARLRLADEGYTGSADDALGYLAEATVDHCTDLLPGYGCQGVPDFGLHLTAEQVDDLVRYMIDLTSGGAE